MDFRRLTQADLDYMTEHTVNPEAFKKPNEEQEYNYALAKDKHTLGIGGFTMIVPGTYWAWYSLSEEGQKSPLACIHAIRDFQKEFAEAMKVRRLMAFLQITNEKAINIAGMMGFKFECRMHNFYGDEPADLYAKYFDKVKE